MEFVTTINHFNKYKRENKRMTATQITETNTTRENSGVISITFTGTQRKICMPM
jgi:hypothetical protein